MVSPSSILRGLLHPHWRLWPRLVCSLSRAFKASSLLRTTCFSPQMQLSLSSLGLWSHQLLLPQNPHSEVKTVRRASIANVLWSSHCQWNGSAVWLFSCGLLGVLVLRLPYGMMGFCLILHWAGWVSYQLYFSQCSKTNLTLLSYNSTSAPSAIILCNKEPQVTAAMKKLWEATSKGVLCANDRSMFSSLSPLSNSDKLSCQHS